MSAKDASRISAKDATVGAALRGLVSSETRIALLVSTVLIGAGVAFGLAFFLQPPDRTFVGVVPLTQLILSVLTPFSTALLTFDLRDPVGEYRSRTVEPLCGRWIASGVYGLVIGVYGAVIAGVAVTVANGATGSAAATDPWAGAVPAIVGSVLIQLIPAGVGCAAGILVPRAGLACLATIVVPVLFTVIVGGLGPLGTADWLTPLGAAGHLVPGPMSIVNWAQWVVTAALWVVLPNWIGRRRLAARAELATR